jgi:hypothetical protein
LQRAGPERIGKPVAVPFFVRMARVNYWCPCLAILYMHSNAWRAGLGPFSRLFDLDTFDLIRRRSLRQLVSESLILRRLVFFRGPFC